LHPRQKNDTFEDFDLLNSENMTFNKAYGEQSNIQKLIGAARNRSIFF